MSRSRSHWLIELCLPLHVRGGEIPRRDPHGHCSVPGLGAHVSQACCVTLDRWNHLSVGWAIALSSSENQMPPRNNSRDLHISVSCGCRTSTQTGCLKIAMFALAVLEARVRNQGVSRVCSFWRFEGDSSRPLAAACRAWRPWLVDESLHSAPPSAFCVSSPPPIKTCHWL